MFRKVLVIIFILSTIVMFDLRVHAAPSPVFGPKRFVRERGAPGPVNESINVCAASGEYRLVVENGETRGGSRISSGSIILNGAEVVKQKEFNQKVGRIEKPVSLKTDNVLSVSLASGPAAFIEVSVVCVSGCLDVRIDSPSTSATINNTNALVRGGIYNANGEVGIALTTTVTGADGLASSALAQAHGGEFAGSVPLAAGVNTITTTATDTCGYKARDTITIEAVPGPYVEASASPDSGIVSQTGTFSATLSADARLNAPVADYSWDTDGDGTIDASGKDLSSIEANYTQNLLYFPRVVVTDSTGNQYSGTTVINVVSQAYIETLLTSKWEGMKGALAIGDAEKAAGYFLTKSQGRYKGIFTILINDLPQIAAGMTSTEFTYLKNGIAKYRIRRTEADGNMTYYIYFGQDGDGIWKIKQF